MLLKYETTTELCVIGGGLSGVCTALACARNGGKVVLMQERPVLGGNASSEIRMWICGSQGANMRETGIIEEIMLKNAYFNPTKNPYIFDSILLSMVEKEENITLFLNCTCIDAQTEKGSFKFGRSERIKNVTGYQMTTQKLITVNAKYFADCSGDSILSCFCNAKYMIGRESKYVFDEKTSLEKSDDMTMGNSCLIQLQETTSKIPSVRYDWVNELDDTCFEHRVPDLKNEYENFWYLELGGDKDTIKDSEVIAKDLRDLALGTYQYLKNNSKYNADNFDLEFLGFLPGKRESKRYVGEYVLTQQDVGKGVKFIDTVAYGGWPMDDHFPGGFYHKGVPNVYFDTAKPYPIPYRITYSKNVDNLFFAGRNVSVTHLALSTTRVMATCGVMGQAVGTAVSLAIKYDLSPHEIFLEKILELQQILLKDDCFLPYIIRNRSSNCGKYLRNGDESLFNGIDRMNQIYDYKGYYKAKNGQTISYQFEKAENIDNIHIVFDSDLDRATLNGCESEKVHATRCNRLLTSPLLIMPKTLVKDFEIKIEYEQKERKSEMIKVQDNKLRHYNFRPCGMVKMISLTPLSNYGNSETTNIISFDFT